MGKPVQIVAVESPRPGSVRIEIDRSLTGTGHERYTEAPGVAAVRPPDVLARRLFETGAVQSVHIFSNLVTISLVPEAAQGSTMESGHLGDLRAIVEQLFVHYRPGVLPTPV